MYIREKWHLDTEVVSRFAKALVDLFNDSMSTHCQFWLFMVEPDILLGQDAWAIDFSLYSMHFYTTIADSDSSLHTVHKVCSLHCNGQQGLGFLPEMITAASTKRHILHRTKFCDPQPGHLCLCIWHLEMN